MRRINTVMNGLCVLGIMIGVACILHESVAIAQTEKEDIQSCDYDTNMANVEEEVFGVTYTEEVPEYEPAYVLGDVEELHIEATAYCYGTTTATGKKVREGYAAMAKGYLGKTAIVYEDFDGKPGDLIGIYEIEDTGGDYRIQEGRCIDIYIPDYDECVQFGRQNVIVFVIDAKG